MDVTSSATKNFLQIVERFHSEAVAGAIPLEIDGLPGAPGLYDTFSISKHVLKNSMQVHAVNRNDIDPIEMPARFSHDVAYFMTPAGEPGVPMLEQGEYWVRLDEARRWLDDGVVEVVSPLDSSRTAEIEITEQQESWLEWMIQHEIQHLRLVSSN